MNNCGIAAFNSRPPSYYFSFFLFLFVRDATRYRGIDAPNRSSDAAAPRLDHPGDGPAQILRSVSRGGGCRGGKREWGRRRRASRLTRTCASVAIVPRNPTFVVPGTKRTPKIRTRAPAGVPRRTSTLALRVFGGFDLVRIRAAHYAHVIGPTKRHRSPTIDSAPAGILFRRDSAMPRDAPWCLSINTSISIPLTNVAGIDI